MTSRSTSFFRMQWILWMVIETTVAGSISTWWYPGIPAPQVIMYDNSTGNILYSLCNSNNTPIFPANKTAAFELDPNFPPINGTSVAGTGYMLNGVYVAAVHYQEKHGGIVHSLWTCNSSGHYIKGDGQGSWNVSDGIGAPVILNQTGLAVLNLGEDQEVGGFRVYFKDRFYRTASLRYTIYGGWTYDGLVTPIMSLSAEVAAGFKDAKHLTVISPELTTGSIKAIEVSSFYNKDYWEVNTFPWPLLAYNESSVILGSHVTNETNINQWNLAYDATVPPDLSLDAFNGSKAHLALSVDSDTNQDIYYIGTDARLHGLSGYNTTWEKITTQVDANWPSADEESGPLAVAYDATHNKTWIYYISNGSMVQVHQSDETTWEKALTLPKFNSTPPADLTSSNPGLSVEKKIGIGIGVGGPILIAAIIVYMRFHIKKSRANRDAERAAMQQVHMDATSPPTSTMPQSPTTVAHTSMIGSPTPGYTSGYWEGGYWANGQWIPTQSGDQRYSYLPDTGAGKPDGDWRQSYGYYDGMYSSISPQPAPVFELPNQERTHEMSNDGQVQEMFVGDAQHTQPQNCQKPQS